MMKNLEKQDQKVDEKQESPIDLIQNWTSEVKKVKGHHQMLAFTSLLHLQKLKKMSMEWNFFWVKVFQKKLTSGNDIIIRRKMWKRSSATDFLVDANFSPIIQNRIIRRRKVCLSRCYYDNAFIHSWKKPIRMTKNE